MAILKRLNDIQNITGQNRLVMILDGMGVSIIKKILNKNGFFYRNMVDMETTLVPATTVAVTTAYRTGKMPYETGFIGWSQYFEETDEIIDVFRNTNHYTGEESKLPHHSNTLPCPTIVEQMNIDGKRAFEIMPAFIPGGCETFEEWLDKIVDTCNSETDAYIYAYWTEPDSALHEYGEDSDIVKNLLRDMEQKTEIALNKIKNKTTILITADHGHRLLQTLYITDYPDIEECMLRPLSIESRCAAFFIKPEKMAKFPVIFNSHFGKWFKLVTKHEFECDYLHSPKPVRYIGDYMALATDDYGFNQNRECDLLISNHAGITSNEMEIPIIQINIK